MVPCVHCVCNTHPSKTQFQWSNNMCDTITGRGQPQWPVGDLTPVEQSGLTKLKMQWMGGLCIGVVTNTCICTCILYRVLPYSRIVLCQWSVLSRPVHVTIAGLRYLQGITFYSSSCKGSRTMSHTDTCTYTINQEYFRGAWMLWKINSQNLFDC